MDKPRHPQVIRTWKVERLKQRYPKTIITTDKYLSTLGAPGSCNAASVIIDADGRPRRPFPVPEAFLKSLNALGKLGLGLHGSLSSTADAQCRRRDSSTVRVPSEIGCSAALKPGTCRPLKVGATEAGASQFRSDHSHHDRTAVRGLVGLRVCC